MIVTIFTDASFDHRTGAAGWAAWMKFGTGTVQTLRFSGAVREKACSSESAELAAIANALHLARCRLSLTEADLVVLQTDCASVIDLLTGKRRKARPPLMAACEASIRDTLAKGAFRIDIRHVRAHRGTEDRRAAVNTWCDESARAAMREKRELLRMLEGRASRGSKRSRRRARLKARQAEEVATVG